MDPLIRNLFSGFFHRTAIAHGEHSKGDTMKPILLLLAPLCLCTGPAFAVDASICGQNADISYHSNGALKSCGNTDQRYVQGSLTCNASTEVSFFENGMVSECTVSGTYRSGDIVCGESGTITFHPSGALQSCTLKEATVINGKKCMGSQPVTLFDDGRLSSCSEQGF